jgi:hypothetical protein
MKNTTNETELENFDWDEHYVRALEDQVRDFEEKYLQVKAENAFLRLEIEKLKKAT